ncbi:hypothetical protein TNCV_119451 [Trichonephila clavipes]|nr:hypothetical protein TNCV_119451 [Trichonephila clavipes]
MVTRNVPVVVRVPFSQMRWTQKLISSLECIRVFVTGDVLELNLGGRTGKILYPSSVALKSKNQEINRLQLAVKLPWAIFFESVDILS